jgi:hypothetical protein
MEGNPAEHDEAVSQFCAMTGTQASDVRFLLDLHANTAADFDCVMSRLRNISLPMDGTSKLPLQNSLQSRTKPCKIPVLAGSDN